jgi:predicted MFS family arabinose efflux permease
MTSLTGLAKNIPTLFLSRALIGVGESSLSPNAMSMLSDVYPQEKRGLATAIYYLGIPLGVGIGFLIASILGPIFGWRNIFISLGIIGVIIGLLIYFMTEPERGAYDKKSNQHDEQKKISQIIKLAFKSITNIRSLWLIMLGGIIGHIPLGVGGFDAVWAVQERGFKEDEYAAIFGILFVVGGSIGAIFGGLMGDYFASRYKGGAMLSLIIVYMFLIPASIYYRFASPDSIYFYIALFLITFQVTVFYGPVFSAVQSLCPYKVRTSILAIWILGVNIVGMGIGSFFTGYLSDTVFSNFKEPLSWSTSLMAAFTFLSLICYHLSRKTYDEDVKKAQSI